MGNPPDRVDHIPSRAEEKSITAAVPRPPATGAPGPRTSGLGQQHPRAAGTPIPAAGAGEPGRHATEEPARHAPELPRRVIAPIAFGTILQPLNSSMIAVALVSIRNHFHAGASAAWVVSALYLATAVAAPAMGRLADMLGPRRVSLGGLALVGVTSAVAPFSPSIGAVVLCRVLIGIGTAAQYPCGVAMIRHAADRTGSASHNALATLSVCSQVVVALGPTLGGLLVGLLDWGGIFWANLPLVAVAAVVIVLWGPADPPVARAGRRETLARLDIPGMLLFVTAVGALMFWLLSLSRSPQWWWLAVLLPATALTAVWSLRAREPFLDLRLLANRALTFTYLRATATFTAFYGVFYGLPQWLEESRGLGPTGAGLVVLPIAVCGVLSTVLATRLQRRRGIWPSLVVGTGGLAVGGLLLTLPGPGTPIVLLLLICAVLGLPNGFNSMANQSAVYAAAPADRAGAASGLYRTSQYVGANLAAAGLALLAAHGNGAALHHLGWAIATISTFLLATATLAWHHHRTA
jgi:MFS family permease